MKLTRPDNKTIISKSPLLISILAATVIFIISIFIIEQRRNIKVAKLRLELSSEMRRINKKINDVLDDMYTGLAATTRIIDNSGSVLNFDNAARDILNSNKHLNNVSLIPGGIIKYTYPEGNKNALNSNILYDGSGEEAAAALAAYTSKKIKIAGPIRNFLKIETIAARLPIFLSGKFWGFSSAVVRLDVLMRASGIDNSKGSKYKYSLSYISYLNNKEVFFVGGKSLHNNITVEEYMSHINWKLYVCSAQTDYTLFLIPSLFSLIASLIIGYFIKRWIERILMLQSLVLQKDQQIADTEKEFKAIFENAPIGFAIIDVSTKSLSNTNRKFRKIFGLDERNVRNTMQGTTQDVFPDIFDKIPKVSHEDNIQISSVYKHVSPYGDEIWTNYKLFALPATSEENNKYVVIAEDVTEKLAAERKIKESEKNTNIYLTNHR
ncbi:PAS domain S-box protein [Niabella ginsengisoli]|uniref:PAS domain S-box protein n=1 Tax=Niabella ginsengisoli TaxID=522298 RepID=A0ABS9SLJ0_9BACT|nr:PAS domain S-box protein [Niabella ginsengisoli]MCH5599248.1 PAS domain S-box protein [Niabella ginsengisoli]